MAGRGGLGTHTKKKKIVRKDVRRISDEDEIEKKTTISVDEQKPSNNSNNIQATVRDDCRPEKTTGALFLTTIITHKSNINNSRDKRERYLCSCT